MPGPYDIRTEPLSYYKRLPFGLGSENMFLSMLPDWLAFGAGTALQRHVIGTHLGQKFTGWGALGAITGFGSGSPQAALFESRLRTAAGGAGWNYAARRRAMGNIFAEGSSKFDVTNYSRIYRSRKWSASATRPKWRAWTSGTTGVPTFEVVGSQEVMSRGARVFRSVFADTSAVPEAGPLFRTSAGKIVGGTRFRTAAEAEARAVARAARFGTRAGLMGASKAEMYAKGAALRGIGGILVGLQMGAMAADVSRGLAGAAMDWRPRKNFRPNLEFGTPYLDTTAALTQRQRAIQAIHDSQLSTRAILGREAAYLHS